MKWNNSTTNETRTPDSVFKRKSSFLVGWNVYRHCNTCHIAKQYKSSTHILVENRIFTLFIVWREWRLIIYENSWDLIGHSYYDVWLFKRYKVEGRIEFYGQYCVWDYLVCTAIWSTGTFMGDLYCAQNGSSMLLGTITARLHTYQMTVDVNYLKLIFRRVTVKDLFY